MTHVNTQAWHYGKSLLTIAALAVAWMSGTGAEETNLIQIGMMLLAWVVSVVGITAVMRADLKRLNQWQQEQEKKWDQHDELHVQMTAILAELKAISKFNQERLGHLEDRKRPRGE